MSIVTRVERDVPRIPLRVTPCHPGALPTGISNGTVDSGQKCAVMADRAFVGALSELLVGVTAVDALIGVGAGVRSRWGADVPSRVGEVAHE
ncbi:hypothetical protein [Nocardia sp. IFM 10818]